MGILSSLQSPWLLSQQRQSQFMPQTVTPFAPMMQEGGAPGPGIAMPQPAGYAGALQARSQPPGGAGAQFAQQPQGWWGRLNQGINGLQDNSLFNWGMALLGNAQNGGDWGAAAQQMQDFGARQQQKKMLENEERRAAALERMQGEQFSWERDAQARAAQQRQSWQQAVEGEQDPKRRQQLLAIGPDGYGEWLQRQDELEFQRQRASVQDRQFAQEMGLGYARLSQDRLQNSLQAQLGRDEGRYIASMRDRLDNWRIVQNDLDRVQYWLNTRPDVFNGLFDVEQQVLIDRFLRRGDQQGATAVQELYNVATNLSRENLRGMTPVSNIDWQAEMRSQPSSASTAEFTRNWLERARQDREMMERDYQSALQWGQQYGNLYAPDPATGRNWYQRTYTDFGSQQDSGVPPHDPNRLAIGTPATNENGVTMYVAPGPDGRNRWVTLDEGVRIWRNWPDPQRQQRPQSRPPGRNR